MLLVILVGCLCLLASGQQVDEDWIDPYDMLNYDPTTKTMKKPAEPPNVQNVPANIRENSELSSQAELISCNKQVLGLKRQIEDLKKKISLLSQQPTCSPVFKRFLSRLLKEIHRAGLPSDSTEVLYDAKVQLSRQAMAEIQTLLDGDERWRTGALDNVLYDLRPHDYEAWKWRFEDTFGVELDTILKISLSVLVTVVIVCTQLWSTVSWLVQFKRLFTVCFLISIIWNWFYLYKIAFAEHQNNIVKMDSVNEKCTGVRKIYWGDSLKEWFRSTWTLQDDPCKKYYEVLMVNPILLVPPTKAISVTITTFITEPLKHVGQGISEFLRALLKDLPITLQIPVLLTIVLAIVVFMYGGVQAAFQYGITAPLRRRPRDPPPELEQPAQGPRDDWGAAARPAQRPRAIEGRGQRNPPRQRHVTRPREERARVVVETLRNAAVASSEDETDRGEGRAEPEPGEQEASATESGSEAPSASDSEQGTREEPAGSQTKPADPSLTKPRKDPSRIPRAPTVRRRHPKTHAKDVVQDVGALTGDSSSSRTHTETSDAPPPVQETSPAAGGP